MSRRPGVDVVVPEGIDDVARPSGGNRYDRRLCEELSAAGWDVRERPVPGDWPLPAPSALSDLAAALTAAPGRVILVDGLLASGAGVAVARAARAGPVTILVHMPFSGAIPLLAESERLAFASAAGLVATSSWTVDLLRDRYGIDGERITVATPGTDPPPLTPVDREGDGSRLLCVAAVTRAKGLDVLAGALERLAGPGHPDWTCTVAGRLDVDAGFAQRLRARLDAAGLSGQVHLTGPLPPEELSASYRGPTCWSSPLWRRRGVWWSQKRLPTACRSWPRASAACRRRSDARRAGNRPGCWCPPGTPTGWLRRFGRGWGTTG